MEVTEFDSSILIRRFKEMAYLTHGITIYFKDERDNTNEVFFFEGGLKQFIQDINKKTLISQIITFDAIENDAEIEIALAYNEGYDEKLLSFVNNIKATTPVEPKNIDLMKNVISPNVDKSLATRDTLNDQKYKYVPRKLPSNGYGMFGSHYFGNPIQDPVDRKSLRLKNVVASSNTNAIKYYNSRPEDKPEVKVNENT